MHKNVASQKIELFAFIPSTSLPKTGDAANITAYVSKDHGAVTVLGDTTATEMDATNAKGVYVFDLTQAESNGDELTFTAKSATSDVSIVPRFVSTNPANFTTSVIDSSGVVNANPTKWLGGTIPAVNVTGVPIIDNKYLLGTIFSTPATAGIQDINVKNINNVAAATPGAAGGLFIAGTNAATVVTTSLTTTFTGNLTGSVGSVTGLTVPSNFSSLSIDASGRVKSQTSVSKNTALTGFVFVMTDSTTHAPKTGCTVTATRSLDGAAAAACTNAPTEIANGEYTINLSAGDMNGNTVTLRFTATAADDLVVEILTTP